MPLAAEDFPKTTSGKIQRSKLKSLVRQGYLHGSSPLVPRYFDLSPRQALQDGQIDQRAKPRAKVGSQL